MRMNSDKNFAAKPIARNAFTLVEMLVSVTLVLLMMTMFASIFQVATDSVHIQRGIAENDQKIRGVTTLIRADIAKRTQRYPLAFYPNEDLDQGPRSPDAREGYFYLSTNDPDGNGNTLLQLTVRSTLTQEEEDTSPYVGAALSLLDRVNGGSTSLYANPNQPEVDDGSLQADNATSSPASQIAYFVRNGNLYRRVTLIRNPRRVAGGELSSQPTSQQGYDFFSGVYNEMGDYDGLFATSLGTSNDFMQLFDVSAISQISGGNRSARIIGVEGLSNNLTGNGAALLSFGIPQNRFGFDQITGLSREQDNTTTARFIGRFLHAETSNTNFNWPMRGMVTEGADESDIPNQLQGSGNPYSLTGTPLELLPGQDLISQLNSDPSGSTLLRGGIRRMEDLLLANVHEFKVEVFDERLGDFVVPGYGNPTDTDDSLVGDFHIRRNLNADVGSGAFNYGPLAPYPSSSADRLRKQPHVFDTWHPTAGTDVDGDMAIEMSEIQAPYISYVVYPPRQNDTLPGPSSPSSPLIAIDSTVPGTPLQYKSYWTESAAASPSQTYAVNDVVFARINTAVAGWDSDGDGAFHWTVDGAANPNVIPDQGFQIAYRCIRPGYAGVTPPSWPDTPGVRVSEAVHPNPGSQVPAVWEAFDNRRPLKAIRMTLRFINASTDNQRQLTLVLPLTDGI